MDRERWELIRNIFHQTMDLADVERDPFLTRQEVDSEMISEIRRLVDVARSQPAETAEHLPFDASGLECRIVGDFRLIDLIGRGGMGVVYRAQQISLGRTVAVKIQHAPHLQERDRERFRREARSIAKLRHPGIVQVLAVGKLGDTDYFAMEYVEGNDLGVELARLRKETGTTRTASPGLPEREAPDYHSTIARLAAGVADALAHAHERGVVHRDIKPSNLVLDAGGLLRIVDFGLARAEEFGNLTRTGEVAGTPYYMSPEQVRTTTDRVDHRTDIYSLGIVLYEALTLTRPFHGGSYREVWQEITDKDPVDIRRADSRVPRDLAVIAHTAMRKEPGHRYATAGEFRDDLLRFLEHRAIRARPLSPFEHVRRIVQRRRIALLVTTAMLVAALASVFVTQHAARARQVSDLEAQLEPYAAMENLAQVPFGRLMSARDALIELRQFAGDGGSDAEQRASASFERLRERWKREGADDVAYARDSSHPEGAREFRRLRGANTLMLAAQLFPDDLELLKDTSLATILPNLSVRAVGRDGGEVDACVYIREINPLTTAPGQPMDLGACPVTDEPITPGYYRVVVIFVDGTFQELICDPGPARMSISLQALQPEPTPALISAGRGMSRYETTDYVHPVTPGEYSPFEGQCVRVAAFYLDRCEVSNREYRRFLAANPDQPAPRYWRYGYRDEYDALPVVGVSWRAATAYAAWADKRLPNATEWQLAARGTKGRRTPWVAEDDADLWRGNVHAAAPYSTGDEQSDWEMYLQLASAVDTHPEARSPELVHHLLGNVDEYTESMMVVDSGGVMTPRVWDRITFGGAVHAASLSRTIANVNYVGIGPNYGIWYRGFRCAKSATPLD